MEQLNIKTDFEKMVAGENYDAKDPQLVQMRNDAEMLYKSYNHTTEEDKDMRQDVYNKLFGKAGKNLDIRAPFYCDYGINTFIGDNVYMNFNCCILDCARVYIGDNTLFAPNVQIYTAAHPVDYKERIAGVEFGKEIWIGKNCWIGGGAIICPGVKIGDNTTIGAGSVVTKDIPSDCVAVGNPCKVIRHLNAEKKEEENNK